MKYSLCFLQLVMLAAPAKGQVDVEKKEAQIEQCLDDHVSVANWTYLTNYFESYLNDAGFSDMGGMESGYMRFINFRARPTKALLPIKDRDKLKAKLVEWKVMDGKKMFGVPFVECFYLPNQDFEKYPESSVRNVIAVAETVSKFNLSSNMVMGGLSVALKEEDLKKNLYKRAVILLGLVDLIYLEEVAQGKAKTDNPIYRDLQGQEKQQSSQNDDIMKQNDVRLERKPQPVGGFESYFKWIYENNKKLDQEEALGKYYRVIVAADVDEKGAISNIGVWRGLGSGFDQEAHRLVKSHPVQKWTPGSAGGVPVKVRVEIEIDFRRK